MKLMKSSTSGFAVPLVKMCSYDQIGYLPVWIALSRRFDAVDLDDRYRLVFRVAARDVRDGARRRSDHRHDGTRVSSVKPASEIFDMPMIVALNTARVPEVRGRLITTIC